jgi:predicted membrane channel-forming protein YqfA (hemolysin III family)
VPFFLADSKRWTHAMWHGFVLAGSALHVGAIALVVA